MLHSPFFLPLIPPKQQAKPPHECMLDVVLGLDALQAKNFAPFFTIEEVVVRSLAG